MARDGKSSRYIATELGVNQYVVVRFLQKYRATGNVSERQWTVPGEVTPVTEFRVVWNFS